MSPLDRFYRKVAAHAASLPPARAQAWIEGHGLLTLAHRPELPATLRLALLSQRRHNLATNLERIRCFQQAVDALGDLPICPLKGIHLLGTVYADDPESRALADLDLLVRHHQIDLAAARLTIGLGLRETALSTALREVAPERCLAAAGCTVELHTRLGIKHGWATTWEDVRPCLGKLHGRDVWLLDPETTLIHLIIHFVKHGPFIRLLWVEDILRWSETGIDESKLAARARRLGALRSLTAGVRAVRSLIGEAWLSGFPANVPGFGKGLLRINEALVWRASRAHPFANRGGRSRLRRNLSACLLADRPSDLLRFLAAKGSEMRRRSLRRNPLRP